MKILIGSAWPYANGSLHIGHISALLPADVLARYHRTKGDDVYYVSGSDCHGTPVVIRAKQEGKTPYEISEQYHKEFCECFEKLGFSYDVYGKTSSDWHKDFVTDFHKKLYKSKYVYEKEVAQAYCSECKSFLADRFVVGDCPTCGSIARGDQCDACSAVLEPEVLVAPKCAICGSVPIFKESKHLFIAISKLEKELRSFIDSHPKWRKNALGCSMRYIDEGLRDRALTRDLDWGIDVPKEGFEGKKIYIWAENVLGYLSASKYACDKRGTDFHELWGEGANIRHYYVHGKDNIPFHSIILPSLLIANGDGWHLPDEIVSSEHSTLEGRKISTSQNHAIWVKDLVDRFEPDSLRYFLIANGPEKRDTDFTWREYVHSHNSELLGAYGNFVNRSLVFISKYLDGIVPRGELCKEISDRIADAFADVGSKIEKGRLKDALDNIFELVRFSNRYFDAKQPWATRQSDIADCENTLFNCIQLIANLAVLAQPFLPFSSEKIIDWLQLSPTWSPQYIKAGFALPTYEILFTRLAPETADIESSKLK